MLLGVYKNMRKMILSIACLAPICHSCSIFASNPLNTLISNIDKECELAQEYYTTKDPNKAEALYTQAESLYEEIFSNSAIQNLVFNELLAASREPNKKELAAVNALILYLNSMGGGYF